MDITTFYSDVSAEFLKKNPDLDIEVSVFSHSELLENMIIASKIGAEPDLIYSSNRIIGELAANNLLSPIEKYSSGRFLRNTDFQALKMSKFNNNLFMLPTRYGNYLMLYYNKAIVKKKPESFEQLIKDCIKIRKSGSVDNPLVYQMSDSYYLIPFIGAFSENLLFDISSSDVLPYFKEEGFEKMVFFVKSLQRKNVVPRYLLYYNADEIFKSGEAAYIISGPWLLKELKERNIKFDFGFIPKIEGNNPISFKTVYGYALSGNSSRSGSFKKQKNIRKFLNFILDERIQLSISVRNLWISTNDAVLDNRIVYENDVLMKQRKVIRGSFPMSYNKKIDIILGEIKSIMSDLYAERINEKEAVKKIQDDIEKKLHKL